MRSKPVAVALFAMLLGGVGAGTATVVAQQSTGDAGPPRAASAPGPTSAETTSSSPTTTSSKPKPKASKKPKKKPTTSTKPKPTRQTSTPKPRPTTTTPKPPKTTEQPQPATPASAVNAVVSLVNQERSRAGCNPVRVDERLNRAATKHSADMQARGYFSHDSPDGRNFVDRVKAEGYPSPGAENIGKGYRSAEAVMEGWMNSEGHRNNILNCDLKAVGVGLAKGEWLWTQVFGF